VQQVVQFRIDEQGVEGIRQAIGDLVLMAAKAAVDPPSDRSVEADTECDEVLPGGVVLRVHRHEVR